MCSMLKFPRPSAVMAGWLGADHVQSRIAWLMLLSLSLTTVTSEIHFEVNRESMKWFDAFYGCYQQNLVLPSAAVLTKGDNKEKLEEIQELLPMWVYAFQIADPLNSAEDESDYFVISSLEKGDSAAVFCRVYNETFLPLEELGTFASLDELCPIREHHLTYKDRFQIRPLTDVHVWIENFDKLTAGTVMNLDGIVNTVHCLVLDENLDLRIDDCQSKHYSICINGSVESTVRYLGNQDSDSIPFLNKPTTHKSGSVVTPPPNRRAGILMDQGLLIALALVGGVVLVAVALAIYCCYCRKRFCVKTKELKLADGYSETMDSIPDNFSIQDNVSEYATPDDTLGGIKFAKPRNSIIEGEYDTLQQTNTKPKPARKVAVVNAYSHVAIVPPNPRQSVSSNDEGHYDVTTFHKQKSITVSAEDSSGNIYGHLNCANS